MRRPLRDEGGGGDVVPDSRVESGSNPDDEAGDHQHVDSDPRATAPVKETDEGVHNVASAEGQAAEKSNWSDGLGPVHEHPKQGGKDHLSGSVASNDNAVLKHGDVRVQLDKVGVDPREDDAAAKGHDEKGEVGDVERSHPCPFLILRLQRVFQGGEDVEVGRGLPLLQLGHGAPPSLLISSQREGV